MDETRGTYHERICGVKKNHEMCISHKCVWIEGLAASSTRIAVSDASARVPLPGLTGMNDAFGEKVEKLLRIRGSSRRNLLGDHLEARQRARTKRGQDRSVGGITPACHQDTTDARVIMAGIEGVPAAAEIDFEPRAEIHRRRVRWHADVAEIAGAVARRD